MDKMTRQELIDYILEKQAGSYDAYNTNNYYKNRAAEKYMDSQYGRPKLDTNFFLKGGPKTVSETKRPQKVKNELVVAQPNFQTKGGPKTVHETKRPPKSPKNELVTVQPNFQTKGDPYFEFKSSGKRKRKPIDVRYTDASGVKAGSRVGSAVGKFRNIDKSSLKKALKIGGASGILAASAYAAGKAANGRKSQGDDYERTASYLLDEMYMEKIAGSYDAYNVNNYNTDEVAKQYMNSQYGKVKKDPNFILKGGPKTVHETKRPPKSPKNELVTVQPNTNAGKEAGRFKKITNKVKGVNVKSALKSAGRAGIIGTAAAAGAYAVGKAAGRNEVAGQDYERTATLLGDTCMEKQAIAFSGKKLKNIEAPTRDEKKKTKEFRRGLSPEDKEKFKTLAKKERDKKYSNKDLAKDGLGNAAVYLGAGALAGHSGKKATKVLLEEANLKKALKLGAGGTAAALAGGAIGFSGTTAAAIKRNRARRYGEREAARKMLVERQQNKEASMLLDGLYKEATLGLGGISTAASRVGGGASGLSNAVNAAASPFAKATVRDMSAAMPKTPATTPSINPPGGVGTTTANVKPVAATTPTNVTTTSSEAATAASKQAEEVIDSFEKSLEKCASEWFGEDLQPKDSEYMANKRLYVDLFNSPNIQW